MDILCLLGMHKWSGCKCEICGKTRDAKYEKDVSQDDIIIKEISMVPTDSKLLNDTTEIINSTQSQISPKQTSRPQFDLNANNKDGLTSLQVTVIEGSKEIEKWKMISDRLSYWVDRLARIFGMVLIVIGVLCLPDSSSKGDPFLICVLVILVIAGVATVLAVKKKTMLRRILASVINGLMVCFGVWMLFYSPNSSGHSIRVISGVFLVVVCGLSVAASLWPQPRPDFSNRRNLGSKTLNDISSRQNVIITQNELEIENLTTQKQSKSATEVSLNDKAPLYIRFFRILCILLFLSTMMIFASVELVAFYDGFKPFVLTSLIVATLTLISVFLISRISRKIIRYKIKKYEPSVMWLIVIFLCSVFVWGQAIKLPFIVPEWLFFIAFLIGFFGSIGFLFMSQKFYLRNYIISGLGILSCFMVMTFPSNLDIRARAQSMIRSEKFTDIINECNKLVSTIDYESVMNQTDDLKSIQSKKGKLLVLASDDESNPSKLQVARLEGYISKKLIVPKEMTPQIIVIVGETKQILDTSLNNNEIALGAPVLFFSWPEKEKIGTAKINAKYTKLSSGSDLWGIMILKRQFASQIEKIVTEKP